MVQWWAFPKPRSRVGLTKQSRFRAEVSWFARLLFQLRREGLATENDINTFKDQLELGS